MMPGLRPLPRRKRARFLDKESHRRRRRRTAARWPLSLGADASAGGFPGWATRSRASPRSTARSSAQVVGFAQAAADGTAFVRRQRLLAGQPRGVLRGDGRRQVLESLEGARARSDQAHGQTACRTRAAGPCPRTCPPRRDSVSACRRRRSRRPRAEARVRADGRRQGRHGVHGASDGEDPVITLDMGKPTEVTSLRYTLGAGAEGSAIGDNRIETSLDGENYTLIRRARCRLTRTAGHRLYFDNGKDPWICTYDARYLRITAVGQGAGSCRWPSSTCFGPSGERRVLPRRERRRGRHPEERLRVPEGRRETWTSSSFRRARSCSRLVQGQPGVQRGGALRRERQRGGRRERRRQHGCQPDHQGA